MNEKTIEKTKEMIAEADRMDTLFAEKIEEERKSMEERIARMKAARQLQHIESCRAMSVICEETNDEFHFDADDSHGFHTAFFPERNDICKIELTLQNTKKKAVVKVNSLSHRVSSCVYDNRQTPAMIPYYENEAYCSALSDIANDLDSYAEDILDSFSSAE